MQLQTPSWGKTTELENKRDAFGTMLLTVAYQVAKVCSAGNNERTRTKAMKSLSDMTLPSLDAFSKLFDPLTETEKKKVRKGLI